MVTIFALCSVELMDVTASESFLVFRAVYAVKPADRAHPYWQEKRAETDGWVELGNDIGLVQYTEGHWGLEYLDGWDFGE